VTRDFHPKPAYRAFATVTRMLEGKERLIFSVLERQPHMGERLDSEIQTDYTIGLGLIRVGVTDDVKRLAKIEEAAKGTDVNVSFAIDGSPVGRDPKRFGDWAFKLFSTVKDKIPRVEIINEPNGTMQPKEYLDTFLRPAYENIKKASPNTKVLAPVMCGISADQARYLEELYKLGLKGLCDELTFHPYAGNFDDGPAAGNMARLQEIIAANGDSAKPVHFTEAGYFHGGWSDLKGLREIVKLAVSQYAWQNAVMGIDHRHNFYYATDGKRLVSNWRELFPTTWMADPRAPLPQWLEITFAGPKKITSVAAYTIAFATWTPATSGVRDWDVQVWDGQEWQTVDSVTGNTKVSKISRLKPPVTTEKVRVLIKATAISARRRCGKAGTRCSASSTRYGAATCCAPGSSTAARAWPISSCRSTRPPRMPCGIRRRRTTVGRRRPSRPFSTAMARMSWPSTPSLTLAGSRRRPSRAWPKPKRPIAPLKHATPRARSPPPRSSRWPGCSPFGGGPRTPSSCTARRSASTRKATR